VTYTLGWIPDEKGKFPQSPKAAFFSTPPPSLDWRNKNGNNWITPIRNQQNCGSCVAFGTVATFEAAIRIADQNPTENIDLSEQHLFSCGGGSCQNGWYIEAALDYMKNNGVPSESCYPYKATDGGCSNTCPNWQSQAYKIGSWAWVASDPTSIELALVNGPVVAAFDVYYDFFSYTGGIYHYDGISSYAGGHAVSLVGYDNAQQYWIAKNSWGSGWGESGFFRIGFGEVRINSFVHSITYVPPITTTTATSTTTGTIYTTATTTATTTSYTSTSTSTSTIPIVTTAVLVPLTMTSTARSTEYQTSILTTTVTSYTSTQTSTSTIPAITTLTVAPSTTTSTVQTTRVLTSTGTTTVTGYMTTTVTSYTSTTISTGTSVLYTTVTKSGASPAASSSLAYLGFLSLLAFTVSHMVTAGKGRRFLKVRSLMERRC
jgi:hypothetical protein